MPRVDTEVLARRTEVARRYLQGEMQEEIARAFGVTQGQISHDLKAIRAAWLASAVRDFDAAKAEELARIDEVERAAWEGWKRSQEEKQVATQEKSEDPLVYTDARGEPQIKQKTRQRISLRKEGQAGSPAFLQVILTCIERRCKILGLDAPTRFKIDWDNLTEEQEERLARGEPPEKVLSA